MWLAFYQNYQAVLKEIIEDSITQLEAITFLQRVITAAKTGHAEIDFPIEAYINYAQAILLSPNYSFIIQF